MKKIKYILMDSLIGELKGLKFIVELTSKTLDTDIKSIKKAARKGIKEELDKRTNEIIIIKKYLLMPIAKLFGKEIQ